MYENVSALFTGICDAIRTKDSTTAVINHQDIPARVLAIPSAGGRSKVQFVQSSYVAESREVYNTDFYGCGWWYCPGSIFIGSGVTFNTCSFSYSQVYCNQEIYDAIMNGTNNDIEGADFQIE